MMTEKVQRKRLLEDSFEICPSGLQFCFDRELFLRDEFNVDKFVMRQKKVVSLDVLRDDLMQYFNILKNSLVELINQDYADFVNLSTNLVGVDREIGKIEVPIRNMKVEIESVKLKIQETLDEINEKNNALKSLNSKREIIHSLESVKRCVCRLEKWLDIKVPVSDEDKEKGDQEFDVSDIENDFLEDVGQKLERVGNEFSKLEYFTRKCIQHELMEKFKLRIFTITAELQTHLEKYLTKSIRAGNRKAVHQALRTYLSINKVSVVEELYRETFVRPKLAKVLEMYDPTQINCDELYNKLLKNVDELVFELNNLVMDDNKGYVISSEFDFMSHSIFPEIVSVIVGLSPQFFSPGNPDLFHERYKKSIDFISKLEDRCSSLAQWKNLRSSASYEEFHNKWNVTVYFQIRYQEIASMVDKEACDQPAMELAISNTNRGWNLCLTEAVYNAICLCWSEQVYLPPLRHRFWRLNIQLLNFLLRYIQQIDWSNVNNRKVTGSGETVQQPQPQQQPATEEVKLLKTKVYLVADLYRLNEFNVQEVEDNIENVNSKEDEENKQGKLVWILNELVVPHLDSSITEKDRKSVQQVLQILGDQLLNEADIICQNIRTNLVDMCVGSGLKAVTDIPRLYRRTNKPIPTHASSYVSQVLRPLWQFVDDYKTLKCSRFIQSITDDSVEVLIKNFQDHVRNLLTSVRKMEDSLKNLRRTRGLVDDQQQNRSGGSAPVSDDDKIRHQIQIDVDEFVAQCKKLVSNSSADSLSKLIEDLIHMLSEFKSGSSN